MNRLFASPPVSPLLEHRQRNLLHSLLLLASNAALAGFVGWAVAGREGLVWAVLLMAGLLLFMPRLAPRAVLRLYGAVPLAPSQAPALHLVRDALCSQAGITSLPTLFLVPSPQLNAFAVGGTGHTGTAGGEPPALALSEGLLQALPLRELAAVMAHEISHLRNNDMRVMAMADVAGRVTSSFSFMGQLLLLLHIPWLLVEKHPVPWLLIAILLAAPMASALLQLALSRSRELEADLEAVRLCGDPLALASALARLERAQQPMLARVLFPGRQDPNPSLFRTHPDTSARIRRLTELARSQAFTPLLEDPALRQRIAQALDLQPGPEATAVRRLARLPRPWTLWRR
ncbi:zinc metalloprotease HtpX [Megalodesulfovibrio paquesii]